MKKIVILFVLFSTTLLTNAQIGIQTNSPDASAALDIVATDKGLLIPRVILTNDLTDESPVTNPATGLLVFNTGLNQVVGLYFWDGSSWNLFNAGSISSDYWNLTGNSGTTAGTNFIGTKDEEDFVIKSFDTERMRFTSGGQGLIGLTTPYSSGDFVTIEGNATQNYALNVYSPYTGIFTTGVRGIYSSAVDYGLISVSDTTGVYTSGGYYGLRSYVDNAAGYSIYAKNLASASFGAVIVGSNRAGYTLVSRNCGISSQGDDGFFTLGQASDGIGVIAGGNALTTVSTIATGAGGAFTGYHGLYGSASDNAGIGVIGVGNDKGTYQSPSTGAGGAFSGYYGVYAVGDTANGTGVVGIGNQGNTISLDPNGSGGAFIGDVCGVYGFASNQSKNTYGGYFSNGLSYAYVGYTQNNNVNRKIVGNGTVNTIVRNTKGELVTLTCPEAPDVVFQDYGVGQLIDGRAHIEIDPDLAININVSENHPLKVFVTLEGDCNGVYVTNKSKEGFDVIELQGGKSNVSFSWQIVATRANETYTTKEGNTEIADYSKRFEPAPGPLEELIEEDKLKNAEKYKVTPQKATKVKAIEIQSGKAPLKTK